MKRHALVFGLAGGILITGLKWTEYRFLVLDHSMAMYGGLTVVTFAFLGIWLGRKLTGTREKIVVREVSVPSPVAGTVSAFSPDQKRRDDLGITRRELEILSLVAQGMSNREIAG